MVAGWQACRFLSTTTQEDIDKEQHKKNEAKASENAKPDNKGSAAANPASKADSDADRESDIHIITRAVYRDNDEGYIDYKRHDHIWVIDVPAASDEPSKPAQLTTGDYDEENSFLDARRFAHLFRHQPR